MSSALHRGKEQKDHTRAASSRITSCGRHQGLSSVHASFATMIVGEGGA